MGDDELCRDLDFLIKHQFVSATYRFDGQQTIVVRIYIIPYDLPNVQGRLRVRRETVLSPARRCMSPLLSRVRRCSKEWEGHLCEPCTSPLIPDSQDHWTLAEIYSDLASPSPELAPGWEYFSTRLLHYGDDLRGLGMRSTLFYYQRRSVAMLMQKEMDTRAIPDPLYVPITGVHGEVFYLQPGKLEILRERPMVSPARGGILCEELGTGKTVMILTLIVATIRELSSPEESLQDERLVMTPLAFRHFPSAFETARKRLPFGKRKTTQGSSFPSLVELLLHHDKVHPYTPIPDLTTPSGLNRHQKRQELEDRIEMTPLSNLRRINTPFYLHYQTNIKDVDRPKRKSIEGPRLMYLTSATLVVVPANLLSQWDREIIKHCEYPLRVLILRPGSKTPSAQLLASDYDIILTTYTRFTSEANNKDIHKLHPWKMCKCAPVQGTRVPDCHCKAPKVSPFFQVRWKRLVIDEGHVSSSLSSTLMYLVNLLSVERRWIVTGTPTTNLLGLNFGNNPIREEGDDMDVDSEPVEDDLDSSQASLSSHIQEDSASTTSSEGVPALPGPLRRVWNKYDREDLYKLGNMITHFIAMPQFNADPKLMHTQVSSPLLDPRGPHPGAIQVLMQVMQAVMVRHRIDDIENDVILPPVIHNSVILDLEPYAVKSYNAMQAALAINAVDSQRTGQDYMFHTSASFLNADALLTAVKNMSQLMLWSIDDGLYSVDQLLIDDERHIQTAIKRNMPQEDIKLLHDAFRHIRLAAEDKLWRALQTHEDVPYHVSRMNSNVFQAWTRTPQKDPGTPLMNGFVHVDRLIKMHDFVVRRPLAPEDILIEEGKRIAEDDQELRRLYEESLKQKNKASRRASRQHHDHLSELAEIATKKARAPETLKEMQEELNASIARLDGETTDAHKPAEIDFCYSSPNSKYSALISDSLLGGIRIGHSASSKINWIINEIKTYSPTEKFLVFSDSELSLAHVAEALELIHIKFLRFTAQIESRFREQLVLTFETSETYRVFLMELKHGARGLNLISASRVIFCEPVWQADVESQAIKRAHRIGQTKNITVTTLAIRGTAEERIVTRREALKGCREKIPKLIEESGMRHFIANPKFLENRPELLVSVDEPLFQQPERINAHLRETNTVDQKQDNCSLPPRKRLRFVQDQDSSSGSVSPAGFRTPLHDSDKIPDHSQEGVLVDMSQHLPLPRLPSREAQSDDLEIATHKRRIRVEGIIVEEKTPADVGDSVKKRRRVAFA
ncbi:hypothetical protein AMATHDRAFT_142017 [Amanita thiersii Skay4041]|uniref:Helicase ATP-binding domain-containing protein n=1 Tax=Amanita thiersii Skay4041 TaxID=703135 RepID=A0A2A9NL41_9AGAR|nr:hypothetical protein AMATHDRAFT_142017 [Amanita thiersii Skay4041]